MLLSQHAAIGTKGSPIWHRRQRARRAKARRSIHKARQRGAVAPQAALQLLGKHHSAPQYREQQQWSHRPMGGKRWPQYPAAPRKEHQAGTTTKGSQMVENHLGWVWSGAYASPKASTRPHYDSIVLPTNKDKKLFQRGSRGGLEGLSLEARSPEGVVASSQSGQPRQEASRRKRTSGKPNGLSMSRTRERRT